MAWHRRVSPWSWGEGHSADAAVQWVIASWEGRSRVSIQQAWEKQRNWVGHRKQVTGIVGSVTVQLKNMGMHWHRWNKCRCSRWASLGGCLVALSGECSSVTVYVVYGAL